ncbi:toll/interleukin-1 receptor domain-containing protein [Mucilaginibacter gotjawali]|uniref:TIR domain protein n=2 Tax=Mucilaginibacter gotjawali TaxID=1550579 RepID=A0A110B430_9SPHI|nr:toll/interleukin-1 receptor domain-containing protein [Mucilaginibacter gotjawali]MBB3057459.1 hypothetical protein [Mucilaginibacter gotjawali]BAU55422.1 TIR domain protein [Mucilaginibacter gotjawali]
MNNNIFISHASEDKDEVARPLAALLQADGFNVWYDEFQLKAGDSLIQSIDKGLNTCDFAITILSQSFFSKKWTQRELVGLATRELYNDSKIILPIWHNLTLKDVLSYSAPLADKFALNSSIGLEALAKAIKSAIAPKNISVASSDLDKPIIYINGHNRYTIKDSIGHLATAKKTNWFYTTQADTRVLRDGGMSGTGKIHNVRSNLGRVEYVKEGGTNAAYTYLEEPLIPFKIYEHSIEFDTVDCYTETREAVGTNLHSKFENIGNHVFFPNDRRPKDVWGYIVFNAIKTSIEPFVSKDRLYINLMFNNPPEGSRLILEWDW